MFTITLLHMNGLTKPSLLFSFFFNVFLASRGSSFRTYLYINKSDGQGNLKLKVSILFETDFYVHTADNFQTLSMQLGQLHRNK